MNSITHHDQSYPNHYGVFFTPVSLAHIYLANIFTKKIMAAIGMIFDDFSILRPEKDTNKKSFFKMGESIFAFKWNQTQVIRYGGALYLMAALMLSPTWICGEQSRPLNFSYPIIVSTPFSQNQSETISEETAVAAQGEARDEDEESEQAQKTEPELPFRTHILNAARTYKVDAALIRAIIMAESSNNPRAVSHRGARGLMQLMPTTARWLGVQDSFDPALNIDGGVRYFKRLLDRFDGNVQLALAAYNAGSRYVRKYGGVPPFRATRVYIKKVLNYHRIFKKEMASGDTSLTTS